MIDAGGEECRKYVYHTVKRMLRLKRRQYLHTVHTVHTRRNDRGDSKWWSGMYGITVGNDRWKTLELRNLNAMMAS